MATLVGPAFGLLGYLAPWRQSEMSVHGSYWESTYHATGEVDVVKLTKSTGTLLLGIWLIVIGLEQVVAIPIPALGTVMAVLAIAAGVLILLDR